MASIIILGITKNGGIVYEVLSAGFWEVFGKLTFGAYLVRNAPKMNSVMCKNKLRFVDHISLTEQVQIACNLAYFDRIVLLETAYVRVYVC